MEKEYLRSMISRFAFYREPGLKAVQPYGKAREKIVAQHRHKQDQ